MPELPEVETVRRGLNRLVSGATIASIEVFWPKIINNDVDSFIYIFDKMIKYNGWAFKYILLDTEQYRFNQREVFDDRLPVGWMLYLPVKITHEDAPSAYKLFDVDNDIGTIVVSKDEFNGKDQTDIACANNVEMELAANGLLPLIKGM